MNLKLPNIISNRGKFVESVKRFFKRGSEFLFSHTPIIQRLYWRYSPILYQWSIESQIDCNAPLNPLKLIWVDPNEITYKTGRNNAHIDRYQDIGEVRKGNWDITNLEKFNESLTYQSFYDRFVENKPWEETPRFKRRKKKHPKRSYRDHIEYFSTYDTIYNEISEEGYRTQMDLLNQKNSLSYISLLDVLADEITVDISRDGELLFVDGRHRLSIAKILDLDKVPVVILVRHSEWLDLRDDIYISKEQSKLSHPDLSEFKNSL